MSNDVATGIAVLFMAFLSIVLIWIVIKLERLLDRYRLKYGFDREIERKETSGDNKEEKLNRTERLFKRRVFKD